MARTGDVLTRPHGDRLVFVTTSADTDGDLLEMDVTYPPRTEAPALHLHPHQEETFRVLQGTPQTVRADADEPSRFLWQVRPALLTAAFLETLPRPPRTPRPPA